jgi:hypothetical protein
MLAPAMEQKRGSEGLDASRKSKLYKAASPAAPQPMMAASRNGNPQLHTFQYRDHETRESAALYLGIKIYFLTQNSYFLIFPLTNK